MFETGLSIGDVITNNQLRTIFNVGIWVEWENHNSNTVELCPNCHRKMYELDLKEDISKLLQLISDQS